MQVSARDFSSDFDLFEIRLLSIISKKTCAILRSMTNFNSIFDVNYKSYVTFMLYTFGFVSDQLIEILDVLPRGILQP